MLLVRSLVHASEMEEFPIKQKPVPTTTCRDIQYSPDGRQRGAAWLVDFTQWLGAIQMEPEAVQISGSSDAQHEGTNCEDEVHTVVVWMEVQTCRTAGRASACMEATDATMSCAVL